VPEYAADWLVCLEDSISQASFTDQIVEILSVSAIFAFDDYSECRLRYRMFSRMRKISWE